MNYGVVIEKGAADWQIFQQSNAAADICIEGCYSTTRLVPPPPFTAEELEAEEVKISARIVSEDSGFSIIPWQACMLLENKRWQCLFSAVPAGGLYRIETHIEYKGWDGYSVTRGDMVHHIGVGDVFLIAGQSNASGRSKTPVYDPPEPGVHLLRNSGRWDMATHPVNETTNAAGAGHYENHNPGHSPFLHFAKILKKQLGYPIGLVNTAHGGTPFSWWNPEENGALLDNMLSILNKNSLKPRAMLWYQGEAEGFENGSENYLERFTVFAGKCREEISGDLPVFTVQLASYMVEADEELDRHWGRLRQAQLDAMDKIANVYTVPANDLPLYDCGHISSHGNLTLGERLADAALGTIYKKAVPWRAPMASNAIKLENGSILIEFSPILNRLDVFSVPPAMLPFEAEDKDGLIKVKGYTLGEGSITVELERSPGENAKLHGAWRMNPGVCIPQDFNRLPIFSFYNLPIKEESSND